MTRLPHAATPGALVAPTRETAPAASSRFPCPVPGCGGSCGCEREPLTGLVWSRCRRCGRRSPVVRRYDAPAVGPMRRAMPERTAAARTCAHCGAPFLGLTERARYCGRTCARRASEYRRRRDRRAEAVESLPPRTCPSRAERDAAMRALYESGATMQDVATLYGVSRERVRQILERQDVSGRKSGARSADPLAIAHAARTSTSLEDCGARAGVHHQTVRRMLVALGMLPACQRLWRLRRRAAHARAVLVWGEAHGGRMPTEDEMNADPTLPCHVTIVNTWGSMTAAARALGLRPNRRGGDRRLASREVGS